MVSTMAMVAALHDVIANFTWRSAGALLAAPLGGIRQHEHVQAGKQQQEEWEQWRVDHPGRRLTQSHGDEVGDDGHRKGDRQPAVDLPNPLVPIHWDLL